MIYFQRTTFKACWKAAGVGCKLTRRAVWFISPHTVVETVGGTRVQQLPFNALHVHSPHAGIPAKRLEFLPSGQKEGLRASAGLLLLGGKAMKCWTLMYAHLVAPTPQVLPPTPLL